MAKKRGGSSNATTGRGRGFTTTNGKKGKGRNKTKIASSTKMPTYNITGAQRKSTAKGGSGTVGQGDIYRMDGKSAFGSISKNQAQGGGAMPGGQS